MGLVTFCEVRGWDGFLRDEGVRFSDLFSDIERIEFGFGFFSFDSEVSGFVFTVCFLIFIVYICIFSILVVRFFLIEIFLEVFVGRRESSSCFESGGFF